MIRGHVHLFYADFRNNFVHSYIVNLTNFDRINLPQFKSLLFKLRWYQNALFFHSLLLGLVKFLDVLNFVFKIKKKGKEFFNYFYRHNNSKKIFNVSKPWKQILVMKELLVKV